MGCTHCTGVTKSFVSVYTGVSTTLRISQSKFNRSEQAAKEAVAKNQSLLMEASKGRCIHSKPNTKPVISLQVASLFFTARCSGSGHFQTFRNTWAHPVEDQGQSPWKLASDFRFMTDNVFFPLKVINIFRFSVSFESTLGN